MIEQILSRKKYDVIILGAGVAGLSAALWCDDLRLNALVLEKTNEIGGQLLAVFNPIYNHLGTLAENGRELCDKFTAQLKTRKFDLMLKAEIEMLDLTEKVIKLKSGEVLTAEFIILATGVRRRKAGIEGEEEFVGKGILTSGKRDGTQVRGKDAVIIGGGDAACENALILAEFAAKVWLVHRRREFRARAEFLEAIRQNPKIKILTETKIVKIYGTEHIEKVELQRTDAETSFKINAQFVLFRLGVEPNNELFRNQIATDKNGYAETDKNGETSLKNVFAVGDLAHPLAPTVSTAVGTGATAIKVISSRL